MASSLQSGDGTQNLTPSDEREIARIVNEKAFAKDSVLWKGYAELNFENPKKVKKALKLSKRILAVTRYRIFFFKVKKCEYEFDLSLLDCVQISSIKTGNVTLIFKKGLLDRDKNKLEMLDKGKTEVADLKGKKYVNICTEDHRRVEQYILRVLRESIRHSTDSWPVARLTIQDVPPTWLNELSVYKPGAACGFLNSYLAVSDYRGKVPDNNFILFIKSIVAKKSTDLILSDCPGVDQKSWSGGKNPFDLIIVSEVLEHNTYFESLVIQNIIHKDTAEAVSRIMMKNKTLKRLVLRNCSTTFGSDLGYSLYYNKSHNLSIIDLSDNSMPNNAVVPLAHSLVSVQHVITVLRLHNMDLSSKGMLTLAEALTSNWGLSIGLEELDISNNSSDEKSTDAWISWFKILAGDGRLTRLSLASTGMGLIVPHLSALPLKFLDISGLKFKNEDDLIKFVTETTTIETLRVADCSLSVDGIVRVLGTLSKNQNLFKLNLDISKNTAGQAGGPLISQAISGNTNFKTLNISSMSLKAKGLVPIITDLPHSIEHLICDDNFESSGESQQEELSQSFVKLLSSHPLTHLSIDAKKGQTFGAFFAPIFKLLKKNTTLVSLNIANQDCGDTALSQLCRALHKNTSLRGLKFPGNNITYNGFLAFAQALLHNTTLTHIEFFDEIAYEKACSGNKGANDLLARLDQTSFLRRNGIMNPWKDLFLFENVIWETPKSVAALPTVPTRLQNIKVKVDWSQLEVDATPFPAPPVPSIQTDPSSSESVEAAPAQLPPDDHPPPLPDLTPTQPQAVYEDQPPPPPYPKPIESPTPAPVVVEKTLKKSGHRQTRSKDKTEKPKHAASSPTPSPSKPEEKKHKGVHRKSQQIASAPPESLVPVTEEKKNKRRSVHSKVAASAPPEAPTVEKHHKKSDKTKEKGTHKSSKSSSSTKVSKDKTSTTKHHKTSNSSTTNNITYNITNHTTPTPIPVIEPQPDPVPFSFQPRPTQNLGYLTQDRPIQSEEELESPKEPFIQPVVVPTPVGPAPISHLMPPPPSYQPPEIAQPTYQPPQPTYQREGPPQDNLHPAIAEALAALNVPTPPMNNHPPTNPFAVQPLQNSNPFFSSQPFVPTPVPVVEPVASPFSNPPPEPAPQIIHHHHYEAPVPEPVAPVEPQTIVHNIYHPPTEPQTVIHKHYNITYVISPDGTPIKTLTEDDAPHQGPPTDIPPMPPTFTPEPHVVVTPQKTASELLDEILNANNIPTEPYQPQPPPEPNQLPPFPPVFTPPPDTFQEPAHVERAPPRNALHPSLAGLAGDDWSTSKSSSSSSSSSEESEPVSIPPVPVSWNQPEPVYEPEPEPIREPEPEQPAILQPQKPLVHSKLASFLDEEESVIPEQVGMKRGNPPPPPPPAAKKEPTTQEKLRYQLGDGTFEEESAQQLKLNIGVGSYTEETIEQPYQLKFKPINFLDKPEEPKGPIQIKLRPVVQATAPSEEPAAAQIQLRHVDPSEISSSEPVITPQQSSDSTGAMKRGTPPPPPPGGMALKPSQIAQAKALATTQKKTTSLADELANAVQNARSNLRKVMPPQEKNYALEEKITVTPFSHFAKQLEEHTVTKEDIEEKLRQAEQEKTAALNAPITEVIPYDLLKDHDNRPAHCVPEKLHLYLSDQEFIQIFKMDKEAFGKQPQWKQTNQRKQVHLW